MYSNFFSFYYFSSFPIQSKPSVPGAFTTAFSSPGAQIHLAEIGEKFNIFIWFDFHTLAFTQQLLVWGNTALSSCCKRTAPDYRGAWRAIEVKETVQGNNLWSS